MSSLSMKDLVPSYNKKTRIKASGSLKNLLKIDVRSIAESDVTSRIEGAIDRANVRILTDLKKALENAILSDIWRTNDGVDDIYETGELMNSGTVTFSKNGITVAYSAPYAALVHYGGYIHPYGNKNISVYLPPRPWVEAVFNGMGPITAFDFASYYREEIERSF